MFRYEKTYAVDIFLAAQKVKKTPYSIMQLQAQECIKIKIHILCQF